MLNLDKIFPNRAKVKGAAEILGALPALNWQSYFVSDEEDLVADIHESCVIGERVRVGEGTTIEPFVMIEEDVVIGKNCLVRSGALIRSHTVIGNDCVIGHNAEIKHAFIFDKAKVQGNTFVGDSIVGYGARIGTGVVTGNRRFDQKVVDWTVDETKIESGHDKLGALIGDYVRLGANTALNPGTIVEAYTWVTGGNGLTGYIPAKKFVKADGSVVDNHQAGELVDKDSSGKK